MVFIDNMIRFMASLYIIKFLTGNIMQNILPQTTYENGLAQFIMLATELIERGTYPTKTAAINHDIHEWYYADNQINAYIDIGTIKPYLEFAYSAGDITLKDKKLNDFHLAFFELAQHYKAQKEAINLDTLPKQHNANADFIALEDVLPEWLDNFAEGFDAINNTFTLPALKQ